MLCALETGLRTSDLDTAVSHCPLLNPFYQAPAVRGLASQASASQLPGQFSHHSTVWHRARHRGAPRSRAEVQPGTTPGPPISTDGWGGTELDPHSCTASQGCQRGYINSYLESHKQRVGLSADLASVDSQQATTPTIREATQNDAHFLALDSARLCSYPGSLSGHTTLADTGPP